MPVSTHTTSPVWSSTGWVGVGYVASISTARGMTWNTGSTVFAVAPRSAIARRNAPDTVVALDAGERERPHPLHRFLVDALRDLDAAQLVLGLGELRGPEHDARVAHRPARERGPQRERRVVERDRPFPERRDELLGAFGGLDREPLLDRSGPAGRLGGTA